MDVILYTTKCPKCNVLEAKLKNKNISYLAVSDIEIMKEKGFMQAPVLEVDGVTMDFVIANNWINAQKGNN